MTVLFADTFGGETGDVSLALHSPDTGDGWIDTASDLTRVYVDDATESVKVAASKLGSNTYAKVDQSGTVPGTLPADGRIRFIATHVHNSGTKAPSVMFRTETASGTGNDGYGIRIQGNDELRIYNYTDIENDVSSVVTEFSATTMSNGGTYYFQITMDGSTITVEGWSDGFEGSSAESWSGTSFTDSSHTSKTGCGIACINAANTDTIDDFEFDDLAASGITPFPRRRLIGFG